MSSEEDRYYRINYEEPEGVGLFPYLAMFGTSIAFAFWCYSYIVALFG